MNIRQDMRRLALGCARACPRLRLGGRAAAGHDVEWSGNWPQDPGDEEILAYARREARTLVTLDKDFGEIAVVQGVRHNGILRIVQRRRLR